jgi:hypothetical protein
MTTAPAIPAAIFKRAAHVPQKFALFILLDSIPYCEAAGRTKREYDAEFQNWRKITLPTLKRSVVRYFQRDGSGEITEFKP